jgi:uncharacterized protein (TIGR02145 family)
MRSILLILIFAFFFASCGEVGESGTSDDKSSSSSGEGLPRGSSNSAIIPPPGNECSEEKFESRTEFCFNGRVYSKCGSEEYNPFEKFCLGGKAYPLCGGEAYDISERFCFGNKSYPLCGGKEYDYGMLFCFEENLYLRSGCNERDPETEFCFVSNIYPRCNGKIYNPEVEFCFENQIYLNCGETQYDPLSQFCFKLKTYPICEGKMDYDPLKQFCSLEKLYDMCGGKEYNPTNQICKTDEIYEKCGSEGNEYCCNGRVYDNTKNFCYEDELYPRCGGKDYNPYDFGCFGTVLYDNCFKPGVLGKCVYKSVLRCKQMGEGEAYMADPLPGMTCEANIGDKGLITGTIKSNTGVVYKTVQIGTQVWMAENLRLDLSSLGITSTCREKYGCLYDWTAAMGMLEGMNKNWDPNAPFYPTCNWKPGCITTYYPPADLYSALCPEGFYIPRKEDWQTLIDYAGGKFTASGRLKSKEGWLYDGNGINSYGFNALPGGYEYNDSFFKENEESFWWTSSETGPTDATYIRMIYSDTDAREHFWSKGAYRAYVRCLHY